MISPRSYASLKPPRRKERGERKHLNKAFYNSKAWRETRAAYIRQLTGRLIKQIPAGHWVIRGNIWGTRMEVTPQQATYILSRGWTPCEICLKLYLADAYDTISEGVELDHIEPVNPENALDHKGFGSPFDFDNLQLLCYRHHSRKSNRQK